MYQVNLLFSYKMLVGKPYPVSPGVQLPPAKSRREAICTHTPSSGNAREAQRLR